MKVRLNPLPRGVPLTPSNFPNGSFLVFGDELYIVVEWRPDRVSLFQFGNDKESLRPVEFVKDEAGTYYLRVNMGTLSISAEVL